MLEDFRSWIRRHLNVVMPFMIGMTFGISTFALAFFYTRNRIAADIHRYGVQVTGHPDLHEDLVWLFCGIVIGATVACFAWWRDNKARTAGLENEHALNRLYADPGSNRPRIAEIKGKSSARE